MGAKASKRSLKEGISDIAGRKIKLLRMALGLSQQALADQCDISRTYLACIETGHANPTLTVLESLAAKLNVEIGALCKR